MPSPAILQVGGTRDFPPNLLWLTMVLLWDDLQYSGCPPHTSGGIFFDGRSLSTITAPKSNMEDPMPLKETPGQLGGREGIF